LLDRLSGCQKAVQRELWWGSLWVAPSGLLVGMLVVAKVVE
jgi:hypothetical protein